MNKFRSLIDRLERGLLRWTRTLVTIAVLFLLLAGLLTLFSSLSQLGASPDVTLADEIDTIEFDEPDIRNVPEKPAEAAEPEEKPRVAARRQPPPKDSQPYPRYSDEISDIVENLRPLVDALEINASRAGLRDYTVIRIKELENNIAYRMNSVSNDVALDHLDDAVDGMVEFADDLADYYGDEIDLDRSRARAETEIAPAFERHLKRVLDNPLGPYVEEFTREVKNLADAAEYESNRAAQARAEAATSLGSLGFIALSMLGGVLLLLVFRVELSLRRQAEAAAESGPGESDPSTIPSEAQ